MVSVRVGAAAIAGLLLDGSFGGGDAPPAVKPAAAPQTIAHEGLRVQVPSGWVRGDVVTVPGFSRSLGLRNVGERLRAAVERLPATSATLLPAAFVMTLKRALERPDVVRLASGRHAWRYRFSGRKHEAGREQRTNPPFRVRVARPGHDRPGPGPRAALIWTGVCLWVAPRARFRCRSGCAGAGSRPPHA